MAAVGVKAPPAATSASGRYLPARCFHCGETNPAQSRWRADVDGVDAHFCCAGCMAVAQTIRAAGLSSFYELRDRQGAPATAAEDAWTHASDALSATAPITRSDGSCCEVALLLDGLRCGACVWLLETWLERQPGVCEANVNFATRRARLRFDSGQTGLAELLRAIERIGYRACPYDPQRREALVRKESRALLLRTTLALLGMMQVMMFAAPAYIAADGVDTEYLVLMNWASLILACPVVLYSGLPFFVGAWRDCRSRRPGMDVPIALGIAGAFGASAWSTVTGSGPVYFDSVTMFISLVLLARLVELRVREKAGDAVESLARELPSSAERLDGYPLTRIAATVPASSLEAGDWIRVAAGASLPADGCIVEGRSSIEEAVLTGESWPGAKGPGDRVLAGSVNRESPLIVHVTAAGERTALAALSHLVERAANERPRVARLADQVATTFVVALLGLAAISAATWWAIDSSRALAIAVAVLVVSCPCALSLATPAALACAAGALGRRQILCVRPDALEALARVTHVVLDKTGTLTTGDVRVLGVTPLADLDGPSCVSIAAALEQGSSHPISRALRSFVAADCVAHDIRSIPGQGVEGTIDGKRHRCGRPEWVAELCAAPMPPGIGAATGETPVALASATSWIASIRCGDTLRNSARPLVAKLTAMGLRVSIVSGDRAATVSEVARAVGIAEWHAGATPEDKHAFIAALQRDGAVVAMVGDGLNDAPGLARADVSMALGSAATLTQWTADAVVLGDDLTRVAFALAAAQRAFRVIRQNLGWALVYNAMAIPLAASGHLSALEAAVGMSVSSLVVVGNAWRLSRSVAERRGGADATNASAGVPGAPVAVIGAPMEAGR